ncbi:hypothetical protein M1563_02155 [Patescibacteria group bacterium]|nr:hypothetical protein [Patescibacteria group bacterium]MCL5409644.1 hypothetical protein [Patescibacteria group bacterium]
MTTAKSVFSLSFIFVVCSLFLLLTKPAIATTTFTITGSQNSYDDQAEIVLYVDFSGLKNTSYFLAGVFQKQTGDNYFGLTWNGDEYIPYTKNEYKKFLSITTDEDSKWHGELKVKIDRDNNAYQGPDEYLLKINRFTQAGGDSLSDTVLSVNITSTITPTPSPSPTPTINPFLLDSTPNQITCDQTFSISMHLNQLTSQAKYYLKGAFNKEGSSNYFGKTKVDNNWISNNQTYSQQFAITTSDQGSWDGNLEIMSDPTDSGFTGKGQYFLKIARYSENGSGPTWSNQQEVTINNCPSPTPTPPVPTSTPTPTKRPMISPTGTFSSSSANLEVPNSLYSTNQEMDVKGLATVSATEIPANNPLSYWLMIGGIAIMFGSLVFVFLNREQVVQILKRH